MPYTDLGKPVRDFFQQHLLAQRGLSGHTVLAYRDALKLFLQFAARHRRKPCTGLTLEDLNADTLRRFLEHLERERHNTVPTRNLRLAAIHSFFQYLATIDPRHLNHCRSILAVPFKRQAHRVPEYLQRQEVQDLFAHIDCRTPRGQRDDALLRLLYNTGMRAQELVDLDVNHVRFSRPYYVRIRGKGRRERTCPLWNETVGALRRYLQTRSLSLIDALPLFLKSLSENAEIADSDRLPPPARKKCESIVKHGLDTSGVRARPHSRQSRPSSGENRDRRYRPHGRPVGLHPTHAAQAA